jgi:hypothetical protein
MTRPTSTTNARPESAGGAARARRIVGGGLAVALVLSLLVHLGFSLWPVRASTDTDPPPLTATITELPPPPATVVAAIPKPRAKAKRAPVASASEPVADVLAEHPEPVEAPLIEPTPDAIAMGPELPTEPVEVAGAELPAAPAAQASPDVLPPRVDLVYKGYLGTDGFEIGHAIYRFEHDANGYRITTIGELRGLLALFFPGQARLESSGTISSAGLQPHEFSLERGSKDRREVALFDWETGIVLLHEQKTAALEIPTFDALSIMWQYYFSPPAADEVTFSLATTRKVNRYTVTREGHEMIRWGHGEIDTVRWHHKSEDGRLEGYAWLAPSMHFIPIKMRYIGPRATVEGLLDSIRVDEPLARR